MRAPLSRCRLKARTSVRVSSLNLGHSVHLHGVAFFGGYSAAKGMA